MIKLGFMLAAVLIHCKLPARDRKEQREHSKPGSAKQGHDDHSGVLSAISL